MLLIADSSICWNLAHSLSSRVSLAGTITSGILSAKHRAGLAANPHQDFLQTDAAVNPGNSGGPLVDADGKVIGVNTAIVGDSYQGISFAIPSEMARESYDRLRKDGYIERGFLGVIPQPVPDRLADDLDLEHEHGVWVAQVDPDTPAEDAARCRAAYGP